MASTSLTPALRRKVQQLFPETRWSSLVVLLEEECGDGLPLLARHEYERARCVVP